MTNRTPPALYARPTIGTSKDRVDFFLTEQKKWEGATPLFMVCSREPGAERILAERCLLRHGQLIVDALRAYTDPELW